jgi:hypothetical protein
MAVIFRGLRNKLPVTIRTVGFGWGTGGTLAASYSATLGCLDRGETTRVPARRAGPPESLRTQIDRLRELEEQSPSIISAAERWDKRRH